MSPFGNILRINNILTTAIGLPASALVFYYCFTTRTKEIRDYRIIIAFYAFSAFCMTLIYTALQMVWFISVQMVSVNISSFKNRLDDDEVFKIIEKFLKYTF